MDLRGAGFPVGMLQKLAAPDAVAAIDTYLHHDAAYGDARRQTLTLCRRLLGDADGDARRSLRRAERQIAVGGAADLLAGIPEMKPLLDILTRTQAEATVARDEADASIARAIARISDALREIGADARFREAVTWQNRRALHGGIDVLLRTPRGTRNNDARKQERLITLYLQRYCAKNETIGFFGPIGCGTWSDGGAALTQRPGRDFVAERKIHFEYRAIKALADSLSKHPDLRKWLRPRLNPRLRIEGNDLVLPDEVRKPLAPDAIRVLALSTGEVAAIEIAQTLGANPGAVYRVLDLAARGNVVTWAVDVPVGPYPERRLREILASVGDPALLSQVVGPLDRLESARDNVAASAGDAEAVDAAIGALEAVFTEQTTQDAQQHPGEVYAGRGLVYEDCRRQTEVEIGPQIRRHVGPPLALVLKSARWFSHAVAARFDVQLNRLYADLKARFAPQPVPLTAMEFLFDPQNTVVPGIVRSVVEDLTSRWASILRFEPGARRLQVSSDALRGHVASAFDAPCPGWPAARHHSADILIAADGPDSIESGRCSYVLGEIHPNDTMLTRQLVLQMHPRPEELAEAYRHDVDQPRIYRLTPRNYRGHRKLWDPFFRGDFQLAWEDSPPWRPNDEVLRIADLIMEKADDGFVVRTREGAQRFPAAIYFERLLWGECLTSFRLLPPARHVPRITVDRLVVHRESWRYPCRELAFIDEKSESDRFIGARRWAREHDLPHWVFVRFPQEYKPLYVDLESPASVEVMAKLSRGAIEAAGEDAELAFSEMLPTPAEAWLRDGQGNTYISELRIVTVDPQPWRPAAMPSAG